MNAGGKGVTRGMIKALPELQNSCFGAGKRGEFACKSGSAGYIKVFLDTCVRYVYAPMFIPVGGQLQEKC